MAACNLRRMRTVLSSSSNRNCCFSTASSLFNKWRVMRGLEPCPNRFGPLTNLPDYSFVDGRPAPLSHNAYKKLKLHESYCSTIMKLSSEIDFAVDRYEKLQEAEKEKIRAITGKKLKPKGNLMGKKDS